MSERFLGDESCLFLKTGGGITSLDFFKMCGVEDKLRWNGIIFRFTKNVFYMIVKMRCKGDTV